jgi:branched-chain amino acid transport system permease protein
MGLAWLIGAYAGDGVRRPLDAGPSCFVLGGLQVVASTFISPILGGLTIAVLAAVALRLRPQGFARA